MNIKEEQKCNYCCPCLKNSTKEKNLKQHKLYLILILLGINYYFMLKGFSNLVLILPFTIYFLIAKSSLLYYLFALRIFKFFFCYYKTIVFLSGMITVYQYITKNVIYMVFYLTLVYALTKVINRHSAKTKEN